MGKARAPGTRPKRKTTSPYARGRELPHVNADPPELQSGRAPRLVTSDHPDLGHPPRQVNSDHELQSGQVNTDLPHANLDQPGQVPGHQLNRAATGDIHVNPLPSVFSALGENVSNSNKTKITNGEFIELGVLLDNSWVAREDKAPKRIYLGEGGELLAKPKASKKINSISEWTDAFLIFSSIYSSVHPEKFQDLLKYMQTIRLGASRTPGMGWRSYDEQFRLRLGTDPGRSWATVDNELWLIYMYAPSSTTGSSQTVGKQGTLKCYDFNYQGSCSRHPCSYAHRCMKCDGNHPKAYCGQQPQGGGQNSFRPQIQDKHSGGKPRFQQQNSFNRPRYMGPRPFSN